MAKQPPAPRPIASWPTFRHDLLAVDKLVGGLQKVSETDGSPAERLPAVLREGQKAWWSPSLWDSSIAAIEARHGTLTLIQLTMLMCQAATLSSLYHCMHVNLNVSAIGCYLTKHDCANLLRWILACHYYFRHNIEVAGGRCCCVAYSLLHKGMPSCVQL